MEDHRKQKNKEIMQRFNNRGEMYVTDIFRVLIFISILGSAIFIPYPFIQYLHLSNICQALVEDIQRQGMVDESTYVLFETLTASYNIDPEVEFDGNFQLLDSSLRVQMNEEFAVTLTDSVDVFVILPKFSERLKISVPISRTILGKGRYYWRD